MQVYVENEDTDQYLSYNELEKGMIVQHGVSALLVIRDQQMNKLRLVNLNSFLTAPMGERVYGSDEPEFLLLHQKIKVDV